MTLLVNSIKILEETLMQAEGFNDALYQDDEGNWTGGWGHLITQPIEIYKDMTRDDWLTVLKQDIHHTLVGLAVFVHRKTWNGLSQNRQMVIAEMAFQMGVQGVVGFTQMWKAIKFGNFKNAAKEMLDSFWGKRYRTRASRLAKVMETNKL